MRLQSLLAVVVLLANPMSSQALTVSDTYYEDSKTEICSNVTDCYVAFPLASITAGKFLLLQEVGCYFRISGAMQFAQYYLTDGGIATNIRRIHYINVPPLAGVASFREESQFKITGGPPRTLVVGASAQSSQTSLLLSCTITGRISPT